MPRGKHESKETNNKSEMFSFCQTPVQVQQSSPSQSDKELTLFSPCYNNKNNKNKKRNPDQNLPEGSALQS